MKIALAQTNPTIGAFKENIDKIRTMADRAKDDGCDLIIFSELIISGYPPMDLLDRPDFVDENIRYLHKLVASIENIGVICGFVAKNPDKNENPLYNSAALFENGRILHQTQKRLLPNYDVFDENRYFRPGQRTSAFPYRGHKLGITICEDIWNDKHLVPRRLYTPEPVAELLGAGGLDLFVNIAASPFHLGKSVFRYKLLAAINQRYGLPSLYVNQVGGQDSLLFDGQSLALAPDGSVAACANRFREDLIVVDTATWKGDQHLSPAEACGQVDPITILKEALVMGIRDYVGKCGFQKGLLGLSGGIDSAVSAALACEALGAGNIWGVALPSPYSSKASVEDARELAGRVGQGSAVIALC